ncbi:MAG TPA: hypothetical protein VFU78_12200 [Thermomicrobiales bacterium]|nr:hypothetical protein [Thermomicrobiales bacterium]
MMYVIGGGQSSQGALTMTGIGQAVPATPYRLAVCLHAWLINSGWQSYGIFHHDSSVNKQASLAVWNNNGGAITLATVYWSAGNETSWGSLGQNGRRMPDWLGIYDDGTTRFWQVSYDGLRWQTIASEARTTGGLTAPTHGGVYASGGQEVTVWSFEIA